MPISDTLSYFTTLIALAVAPGPVVLMLMARAASSDVRGAICFGIGSALGGVTIVSAVCFGLSAWFAAVPEILAYSKYALIAYIAWIAFGIWKGGFDLNGSSDVKRRSVMSSTGAGFLTCMISPYYMVLLPLTLPELMDITVIKMPDFLIVAVTTFLGLSFGAGLIVGFAAQLRRIAKSPRATLIMNRSLAAVLVTVGGGMALI